MKKVSFLALMLLLAGCAPPAAEEQPKPPKQAQAEVAVPAVAVNVPEEKVQQENKQVQQENSQVQAVTPAQVRIPKIGVEAAVEKVGTLENGQMDVPKNIDNTGWYASGTKPGDHGTAVIAGHVDSKTGPAVFYKLDQLKKDDLIEVQGENGEVLTFRVYDIQTFPRLEAPIEEIFGFTYRKTLNLITCTGTFNREARTHEERLVVYTELVEETK